MATADFPRRAGEFEAGDEIARARPAARHRADATTIGAVLSVMASLRLTVVLLSMLTFLVFAGTLAQVNHDVWFVVWEGYFRVWIAKIEFQTIPSLIGVFHPNDIQLPGWFPFPGGYLIGTAMAINLLAAHGLRFRITAKGKKLAGGLVMLVVGVLATIWVVRVALDTAHEATITPEFADRLWQWLRAGFAGAALAGAFWLSRAWGRLRRPEWLAFAAFDAAALGVAGWLLLNPEWQIQDANMRIVWQMLQATLAGGLLLASCWLLFRKRAGVVLLHAGVAVLMAHELYTAVTAEESQMSIVEGESADFTYDIRQSELAFSFPLDAAKLRVVAIPDVLLRRAADKSEGSPRRVLSHPDLQVDVRVIDYFRNSKIRTAKPSDDLTVTIGSETLTVEKEPVVSGVGGRNEIDVPAATIELLDKNSGEILERVIVSSNFDQQVLVPGRSDAQWAAASFDVEGQPIEFGMRFKRDYKPYSVMLKDFSKRDYRGTNTAKDYSSYVRLVDEQHGADINYRIYMNNPLRYRGETLYQADWHRGTETGTVLQVVKNESWMLPYLACSLVGLGMIVHFSFTLTRFLNRRTQELATQTLANHVSNVPAPWTVWWTRPEVYVPVFTGLVAAGYLASKARPQEIVVDGVPVHEFAALPVVDSGRVKPYDTLARNMLQFLCERQEVATQLPEKGNEKIPATQWLLDVLAGKPAANDYYVFRITSLELLDVLELPRRPKFFKYSLNELEEQVEELFKQVMLTRDIDEKDLTPFQQQVRQLWSKRRLYATLSNAFAMPRIEMATAENFASDMEMALGQLAMLEGSEAPRGVLPAAADGDWYTLYEADLRQHCFRISQMLGPELASANTITREITRLGETQPNPAYVQLTSILAAYQDGDGRAFSAAIDKYNEALAVYQSELDDPANAAAAAEFKHSERYNAERVKFEAWLNAFSPFYYCAVLYLFALVLAAAGWLGWPQVLGRSATALILVTLVVHTGAIVARMYISGRPPITNLYDTLVFNGWAVVIAMLVLEAIYKLGIGNFVAGAVAFCTLLVAHMQADGDTFTVLQAVLDTQFWLTTHVISINLGYATTVLAGCIGIAYILEVHVLGTATAARAKKLSQMMYGTLCFAIVFSFIGTVLGGLWADDSWGRFWGWDPKENGAMMIVLWNALALHARWGKLVGPRGLALLLIVGNVITAWSWFGVNQLGQGLHNYGFDDQLAMLLGVFALSQFAMLLVGLLPWRDEHRAPGR